MRFPALSARPAFFARLLFRSAGLALAAALAVLPARGAGELRVTGSDLLQASFSRELEAIARAEQFGLALDLRGSRLGLDALRKGEADLGLLLFGADDAKPGPEFSSAIIGYLTSVVVVPAGLSLTQINYAQLGGIFGASEVNNHRRWSEVGALGELAPRAISAMVIRRRNGLSLDLFRHNVLQNPELKPTVALLDTSEEAYTRLLGEEGGIAILPFPPPAELKLKVLLLAKGGSEVAYPPTAENLYTGDYPLRMPVHLVFRKGEAGRLGVFIRRLLADEAAPAWQGVGVMPLPTFARNQLVFDLETM